MKGHHLRGNPTLYRKKSNAKEHRRKGQVTVPRRSPTGKRVWVNKKAK